MNDGTINAVPPQSPQTNNAAPVVVRVEELPPEVKPNTVITGQVVAKNDKQVSLNTDNGIIILQGNLNVEIGQKVNFKVQNAVTQGKPNLVAELLNVSADKINKADNLAIRNPIQNIQPIADQKPIDPVIVHDTNGYEEYKPLQALILQMPDILNDETLDVLVKSLLKLPMSAPLPPGLQDGFAKFDQLVKLLSQANLLPGNAAQTVEGKAGVQQNIVSVLQQLLQPAKNTADNPLLNQTPHQFIQLQTIQPGENLSPNILVNIREQLTNILQQQQISVTPAPEKSSGLLQLLIPNALSGLVEKTAQTLQSNMPKLLEMVSGQSLSSATLHTPTASNLFTMPAIGLALGQPPQEIPQLNGANLVLMTLPMQSVDGAEPQHLIALLAPQQEEAHTPLLPGSLIVAALKPQSDKQTSFVMLPKELVPQILSEFASMHPSLGDTWPALDDLWQQVTAQAATQPALQTTIQQVIPQPSTQQFPPTMLFFLSILKNGFTSEWIPEKHLAGIEKLDKAALIKALTQDLQAIKSRMEDAAPIDAWRPLPLPLQVGDQLIRLQWFYRHPEDGQKQSGSNEEETKQKQQKTRFLLNVPKTVLGDLQIDGLVQEKNLDLIMRTESMLPSHMETAIRGRYAAALETSGMQGGINFQFGRDHYVHV